MGFSWLCRHTLRLHQVMKPVNEIVLQNTSEARGTNSYFSRIGSGEEWEWWSLPLIPWLCSAPSCPEPACPLCSFTLSLRVWSDFIVHAGANFS